MELHDFITLGAALIGSIVVICGWSVNERKTRKNNVYIKRLEFRLEVLKELLPVMRAADQGNVDEFLQKLSLLHRTLDGIGSFDEARNVQAFLESGLNGMNPGEINQKWARVQESIFAAIRNELDPNLQT